MKEATETEKENPRGKGRDILGFGLALRTCGVGLAKGKERIVLFVWEQRGSIASKEDDGRKQHSKGNGFVSALFSPENDSDTRTRTYSDTIPRFSSLLFYSILFHHCILPLLSLPSKLIILLSHPPFPIFLSFPFIISFLFISFSYISSITSSFFYS